MKHASLVLVRFNVNILFSAHIFRVCSTAVIIIVVQVIVDVVLVLVVVVSIVVVVFAILSCTTLLITSKIAR